MSRLYGHARIKPELASSFRTAVAKTASKKLCQEISLESGPGPTVARAFSRNQTPYFSMVVQCSMLCSQFDLEQLAAAIQHIFEKNAEDAPPGHEPALPNANAIKGFLRACQEQTAGFNWRLIFLAVEQTLNDFTADLQNDVRSSRDWHRVPLPEFILRGLTLMLPLVQKLPSDRFVLVELFSRDGLNLVVVWAHCILELTVVILEQVSGQPKPKRKQFGTGEAQICVHVYADRDAITLMSTAEHGNEELFHLEPESDELRIKVLPRVPLNQYGAQLISYSMEFIFQELDGIVEEMTHVIGAFALLITRHATFHCDDELDRSIRRIRSPIPDCSQTPFQLENMSMRRILDALSIIFQGIKTTKNVIDQLVQMYSGKPLDESIPTPSRITEIFRRNTDRSEQQENANERYLQDWRKLVEVGRHLAILVVALAHVENLSSCDQLPLICRTEALQDHQLARELRNWDGSSSLYIGEYTWYRAIALLLLPHAMPTSLGNTPPCLVSSCGWSIFLNTFIQEKEIDPSLIPLGRFSVSTGTPWRKGVYRHAIFDGPDKGRLGIWKYAGHAGDAVSLRCADQVSLGRPLYGEKDDSWVVTLQMQVVKRNEPAHLYTRRTGYAELFTALWLACRTEPCNHNITSATLEHRCCAVSGFGDVGLELDHRIVLCLTANNPMARWRALVAISRSRQVEKDLSRGVLLRGNDCCLQCAIDQVSRKGGSWFIVL